MLWATAGCPRSPGSSAEPCKGAQRGDTAQPHPGTMLTGGNWGLSHIPLAELGTMPPAVGWQLLVPPSSRSSDSRKHQHNLLLKFSRITQKTRLQLCFGFRGRLHSSAPSQTQCKGGPCAAGEELNELWPHLRSRLSKWSASCSGDTRKSSKGCWYRDSKDPSLPLLASSWLEPSPARSRRDEALKRFISPFSCLDQKKKML